MCAGKGAHSLPASRLPSLASPIITLAIAIVARSLRSIDPSWPKAASDATDMLAVSKRMIVELARRISSCGWVAWCERRAPVSLGFRVGNPSAIGWYQPANFPASLVPVGVTLQRAEESRRTFASENGQKPIGVVTRPITQEGRNHLPRRGQFFYSD
jgi:hypothetical protein